MPRLTVYLDNSSWNQLAKGLLSSFKDTITKNNSLICYSRENLHEIMATKNNAVRAALEHQLDDLSALLIKNLGEASDAATYKAEFKHITHKERLRIYENAEPLSPLGGFGLADILQKLIGGISSTSYEDIAQEAFLNLKSMLETATNDLPNSPVKTQLEQKKEKILREAKDALDQLLKQINQHSEMRLPELDHVKAANFSGQGTVENIFLKAQKTDAIWVVKAFLSDIPVQRNKARIMQANHEQVLRLAQTLFFLRYKREAKNMKDGERARVDFQGSTTDLDHIANASACSVFHSSDKAQAQLAAAVYDHLNIPTLVCYYSVKTNAETALYSPSTLQLISDNTDDNPLPISDEGVARKP